VSPLEQLVIISSVISKASDYASTTDFVSFCTAIDSSQCFRKTSVDKMQFLLRVR